jgi:hypothetical protein
MVGLRETVSVILTLLSRHEQVVLDRMSAAIGHDVEEPLRSIDVTCTVPAGGRFCQCSSPRSLVGDPRDPAQSG